MPRFNHAFEVISNDEEAEDVTPAVLRAALIGRALNIPDAEIREACTRFDTFNIDEDK